ncbi:unnamed protein product [Vicia faba]|uniref:Uncharacterized protein n=1 Tax=Vicia faba TaxID=3906 RepID=A0AAV0ZUQ5_VICFA|nr:unnamed protein product [Vicia faba]
MDYSAYNLNQPQQPQSYYEYDPSQIQHQPYDQSYAAYQPSYYAGYNHQYAYYPTDTTSHLQHQQTHGYYQSEPAPVHPPGVNPEPVQHNLMIGPSSQYRGRGGRSFRRGGRGRGQFSHGRGRGVGGGRHFPSHSSGPAISDVPGSSSVSAQVQTAPVQPPPRGVFCDICKIECNTPEVMELHLKGKKHLKNIRLHDAKLRRGAINAPQSGQIPTSQLNSTDQPIITQESEDPIKNISSEITTDSQKVDIISQNNVGETSDVPAEESSGARGRGLKRKLRGGKARKQTRNTDGSQPEPAVAITCELCNVKCDTQRVYQAHITGKKHLKRAYGSQALSGVAGLQALYPPDINALATAINAQVQQGDNDPQVLLAQLLVNALSQAQGSGAAALNGSLATQTPAPTSVAGSSYDPQLVQVQVSEIAAYGNPTGESKNEAPSAQLESNAQEGSNVGTQIEGGSSETK